MAFPRARLPCPCGELRARLIEEGRFEETGDDRGGAICSPRTGTCQGFERQVPVALVDVAGLVPGASEGRGRGNAFLADLAGCDALIQVVDGAAATDVEGNPIAPASDPAAAAASIAHEVTFLTTELEQWIAGVLADGWSRGVRRVQAEGERGLQGFLVERLSGLGATNALIGSALDALRHEGHDLGQPWTWGDEEMGTLAKALRRGLFPLHVAVNKLDMAPAGVMDHLSLEVPATACLADMELALRRADAAGLIRYRTGDTDFLVSEDAPLSDAQRAALERMRGALSTSGGTGIEALLDAVVFGTLDRIVVYPVQDEGRWVDGDGRVLPDALVVPAGISAKAVAGRVHSDLEAGFIRGVDGRTRRVVGAEHELEDGDVLKIHAKT
ncbi:MAG: redox-regulated ATPase YchF [Euryarchaeota archaeon]|nr:redox-regulated ATPase YchF [Euryarchaeota archaeon]